jgi:hypothetical protein
MTCRTSKLRRRQNEMTHGPLNVMKFVVVAGAMGLLAGCAIAVPLRLADTPSDDVTCTANLGPKCAARDASRRPPVVGGVN